MATLEIEAGCARIASTNYYVYRYNKKEGEYEVVFSALTIPEIGDFIVDGVHVPRVGYKINNDPGMQANKSYDT